MRRRNTYLASGLDAAFGTRTRIARGDWTVGPADPHLDRHRKCGGLDFGSRARPRICFTADTSLAPTPLIKDDCVRIASPRKSWDNRPIVSAMIVLVKSSRQ